MVVINIPEKISEDHSISTTLSIKAAGTKNTYSDIITDTESYSLFIGSFISVVDLSQFKDLFKFLKKFEECNLLSLTTYVGYNFLIHKKILTKIECFENLNDHIRFAGLLKLSHFFNRYDIIRSDLIIVPDNKIETINNYVGLENLKIQLSTNCR